MRGLPSRLSGDVPRGGKPRGSSIEGAGLVTLKPDDEYESPLGLMSALGLCDSAGDLQYEEM